MEKEESVLSGGIKVTESSNELGSGRCFALCCAWSEFIAENRRIPKKILNTPSKGDDQARYEGGSEQQLLELYKLKYGSAVPVKNLFEAVKYAEAEGGGVFLFGVVGKKLTTGAGHALAFQLSSESLAFYDPNYGAYKFELEPEGKKAQRLAKISAKIQTFLDEKYSSMGYTAEYDVRLVFKKE